MTADVYICSFFHQGSEIFSIKCYALSFLGPITMVWFGWHNQMESFSEYLQMLQNIFVEG